MHILKREVVLPITKRDKRHDIGLLAFYVLVIATALMAAVAHTLFPAAAHTMSTDTLHLILGVFVASMYVLIFRTNGPD